MYDNDQLAEILTNIEFRAVNDVGKPFIQERVLDFSKTIRDFKRFFLKIKVLSKDYGATT